MLLEISSSELCHGSDILICPVASYDYRAFRLMDPVIACCPVQVGTQGSQLTAGCRLYQVPQRLDIEGSLIGLCESTKRRLGLGRWKEGAKC
jgi:hypothetical protein